MNYMKIDETSFCNGNGVRVVLWTSGCEHRCNGCHNQHTWDANAGKETNEIDLICKIKPLLQKDYIKGLSISGGDPLLNSSTEVVHKVILWAKEEFPQKDIWLWTGYLWEDIKDKLKTLMENVDVLIDGQFEIDKMDRSLPYCGSSNQRVIDVQKSLKTGEVVLYEN